MFPLLRSFLALGEAPWRISRLIKREMGRGQIAKREPGRPRLYPHTRGMGLGVKRRPEFSPHPVTPAGELSVPWVLGALLTHWPCYLCGVPMSRSLSSSVAPQLGRTEKEVWFILAVPSFE